MGKKYIESSKLVDKNVLYTPAEALDLAVKTAKAKFDETVELHVRLGVDPRHADQLLFHIFSPLQRFLETDFKTL